MRDQRGAVSIFGGLRRQHKGATIGVRTVDGFRNSPINPLQSQHFLQRLLLIAAFLAVDHHADAVWVALFAVALNLAWAYRYEGLSPARGRDRRSRGKVVRPAAAVNHPLERTRDVIRSTDAAEANLVSLGDKDVLWSADGRAFLMYARQGSRLIALFDPVGPVECWRELMDGFMALARSQRCKPVFYQV